MNNVNLKYIDLYQKGLSLYEISSIYNITRSKLKRILMNSDIPIRSEDKRKTKRLLNPDEIEPYLDISSLREYNHALYTTNSSHLSFTLSLLKMIKQYKQTQLKLKKRIQELETHNIAMTKIIQELKKEL